MQCRVLSDSLPHAMLRRLDSRAPVAQKTLSRRVRGFGGASPTRTRIEGCRNGCAFAARLVPRAAPPHLPARPSCAAWAAHRASLEDSTRRFARRQHGMYATGLGNFPPLRRRGEHGRARRRRGHEATAGGTRSVPAACARGPGDSSHRTGSHAIHAHGLWETRAGRATLGCMLFMCVLVIMGLGATVVSVCGGIPNPHVQDACNASIARNAQVFRTIAQTCARVRNSEMLRHLCRVPL